jgi:hypothetical protein
MAWLIHKHNFSKIISFFDIVRLSAFEKDLEVLSLRQQLAILQRELNSSIRLSRVKKLTLAVLTTKFKQAAHQPTHQLRNVIRIFQAENVLNWHCNLMCKKWTYKNSNKCGRPPTNKILENLIIRIAEENPRWGYSRIEGELMKLSFKISSSTIRIILNQYRILPTPVHHGSIGWRHLRALQSANPGV